MIVELFCSVGKAKNVRSEYTCVQHPVHCHIKPPTVSGTMLHTPHKSSLKPPIRHSPICVGFFQCLQLKLVIRSERCFSFAIDHKRKSGSPMAEVEAKERKILVAVDEGEESMYALSWCLKNVVHDDPKDTLVLLYSKPARAIYPALDGTGRTGHWEGYLFSSDIIASMDKYSKDVADCVTEKARKLCKDLKNVKVETRVENGDPRDVICEMAEKLGADLLVMGTHGYGLIKRAFLGSVSNYCAQHVKCPVLIVKRPKSASASK